MIRLRHMSEAESRAFDRDPETFMLAISFATRVATTCVGKMPDEADAVNIAKALANIYAEAKAAKVSA